MTQAKIYTVFQFQNHDVDPGMGHQVKWFTYSVAATSSKEAEQLFRAHVDFGKEMVSRYFISTDHEHIEAVQFNCKICAGDMSVEEFNRWAKVKTRPYYEEDQRIEPSFREIK